ISYASTLFSYLNPARSPYYAMTASCVGVICAVYWYGDANLWAVLIPASLSLLLLIYLTTQSDCLFFTEDEYADQIKFARSLAVTTALGCLGFLIVNKNFPGREILRGSRTLSENPASQEIQVVMLGVYAVCVAQLLLFTAYAFIFVNFNEKIRATKERFGAEATNREGDETSALQVAEKNYVQISLTMSALLIGLTTIAELSTSGTSYERIATIVFIVPWMLCFREVVHFLRQNFKLQLPRDVDARQRESRGLVVVKIRDEKAA
ncbi:MAG TPA: hypothetical protein VLC74_07470, partial [Rhizomicrobium sp.]|nr:hypothetical protein [Rhizomicrobium sp.]